MIVRFESSHTGEVLMFAAVARTLLDCVGKACTRRGVFTPPEMLPAAARLREAVRQAATPPEDDEEAVDEQTGKPKERVVSLGQRAWPLIDMLERTAQGGTQARILWEAPEDF